jgi:hypothetical protein
LKQIGTILREEASAERDPSLLLFIQGESACRGHQHAGFPPAKQVRRRAATGAS